MKVTYPRVIVFHNPDPIRFTDPAKAAEYWARAKEQEWIEKVKEQPKYKITHGYRRYPVTSNSLYDEARVRYRKLKRRALRIFRCVLATA
jgi:hypothetical protein